MFQIRLFIFTILLMTISINSVASEQQIASNTEQKLSLEDIFKKNTFRTRKVENAVWLKDDSAYLFSKKDRSVEETPTEPKPLINIYHHDVSSGKETLLISGTDVRQNGKTVHFSSFQTTYDTDKYLLLTKDKRIWRHSRYQQYYLYNSSNKSLQKIANGSDKLVNAYLSPDREYLAYTLNNDLYICDLKTLQTKRLSNDGSENILNGVFDWAYEEELGAKRAYRWSPDSQYIAFWRSDQSAVKTFYMLDELPQYNQLTKIKYPKTGEANSIVKIGVVNIKSGHKSWMDIGSNDDIYITRLNWTQQGNTLGIQRLNRLQNHWQLLLADINTGQSKVIAENKSKAWIDTNDNLIFFKQSKQLIHTSEQDGYRHIYMTDYENARTTQITRGNWEVSSVLGLDEANQWIYFRGKKDSFLEDHLYRVSLENNRIEKISQSLGSYKADFSPNYLYYLQTASSLTAAPQISLRRSNGKLIRMLHQNKMNKLNNYALNYPQLISFNTADEVTLYGILILPGPMDGSKKYPVIVDAYGGPGSQKIHNKWGKENQLWRQFLAQQGYISFQMDNRGTGGRGRDFKHLAYGDFSKWAVNDQIEGVKYLRSLPYVDAKNIGFWGKSFGGSMAGLLITRAADYFSTAVAHAMVSDFHNYDTIWTERYMGLPKDNPEGYKNVNVLTYTHLLKGNLLLVHGSGDDNVHLQNTVQWIQDLITQNKHFDLMIYPNINHSMKGGNTRLHSYTQMFNFFNKHLK